MRDQAATSRRRGLDSFTGKAMTRGLMNGETRCGVEGHAHRP